MRISLLRPFTMDMTIKNRRQSQLSVLPKRKLQREENGLAKALTVLCLNKKKPVESLEIMEMITITYYSVKLQ